MRPVFSLFLLLRFVGMFVFVEFALTGLLVLFDLLAHADDLATQHANSLVPMLCYAGLRLPLMLAMITPMSVLLAALVTFERLATQYELVALQSAGVSLYQVTGVLLAGGLMISAIHYVLLVEVATPAKARLFRWAERDYAGLPGRDVLEPGTAWFAPGPYRVSIFNAREQGYELEQVTVLDNSEPGVFASYIEAREAHFDGRIWTLMDGWEMRGVSGGRAQFEERELDMPLRPDDVAEVRLPADSLSGASLRSLARRPDGQRPLPAHAYQTWYGRRFAGPLGSLVMILFAAPLGLQLKRSGHQGFWGGLALGLGFLFFIVERIFAAFGEGGTLAPALATWGPLTVFGLAGLAMIAFLQK